MKNLENLKLKVDEKGLNSIEALESQRDELLEALTDMIYSFGYYDLEFCEEIDLKRINKAKELIKKIESC